MILLPKGIGAFIVLGFWLVGTQLAAQTGPPPPQPPPNQPQQPGPNGNEPPPGNLEVERRNRQRPSSWYNGDYASVSISSILMIDDPVTGFGNEALWTDPPSLADHEQSDIAGSSAPD